MLAKIWSKFTKVNNKLKPRKIVETEFPYLFKPKFPEDLFDYPRNVGAAPGIDEEIYQWLKDNVAPKDWCIHHLAFGECGGLRFRHQGDVFAFKLMFPNI